MEKRPEQRIALEERKDIATVAFADIRYVLKEGEHASLSLVPVDQTNPNGQQQESLAGVTFAGIEKEGVKLAKIGSGAPSVQWVERTNAVDIPVFTFEAQDAITNEPTSIEISEQELRDLFLPPKNRQKRASFFTIDSDKSNQQIGIAIRRKNPVMLLMSPGKRDFMGSPQGMLQAFVNNIHDGLMLSEQVTSFQSNVDKNVFNAMRPNGELAFNIDDSTPTGLRQKNIQKQIYRIQALLLARKAEDTGNGLSDPDLLRLAPFLQPKETPKPRKLFGRNSEPEKVEPEVIITNYIWKDLVSPTEGKLLHVDKRYRNEDEREKVEKAKEIMGNDFIGPEDVEKFATFINTNKLIGDSYGNNLEIAFTIADLPDFPYSEDDLAFAKANNEVLLLRPKSVALGESANNNLTARALIQFFSFNPDSPKQHIVAGQNFPSESWMDKPEMDLEWILVKKAPLLGSKGKTRAEQNAIIEQYKSILEMQKVPATDVKRRTATEALWDGIMYYWKNHKPLLTNGTDWLETYREETNTPLTYGENQSRQIAIGTNRENNPNNNLGVYTQRRK